MQKLNIEKAIEAIKNGDLVIVFDSTGRENEGDFICSAELASPELINFMLSKGRGVLCCPMPENLADKLELPLMCELHKPSDAAFTVSVDAIASEVTTGVASYERAYTLRALANKNAKAEHFARPGHIFPLRAKQGGLKQRQGHTEASVELMKLAGLYPVAALIEILNEDGTMARLPELKALAKKHKIILVSVEEIKYFVENEGC